MSTWTEPTPTEQLASFYSDYHKDLYGFRPRGGSDEFWSNEDNLRAAIADLDAVAPAIHAEEEAREKAAIDAFESFVNAAILTGAGDRETALRWIMEASECDGDWEYLCFCHGLPYHYFKQPN